MPTFGVAAFLKLASLNPKPQKTEMRKRLNGSGGGGYDFHRRLKLASGKHVAAGHALLDLIEEAKTIEPLPERKAMVAGLTKLGLWCSKVGGKGFKPAAKIYESPRGLFKIAFQPEFGVEVDGKRMAFHIWNTKKPDLDPAAAYAALAIMAKLYSEDDDCPDDFGIVSLHEPKAYLLSDAAAARVASASLVARIEELMLDIGDEGPGVGDTPGDQPSK